MAWYSDEEYEFRRDCGEKKRTAASSHKQRTHAGKGGRVRFPSDFKSRKELKAMNGECVTYKLGDPMKWEDFKKLPDEYKIMYINGIRERFGAHDGRIAGMLGIDRKTFQLYLVDLKVGLDQDYNYVVWDEEAWNMWAFGLIKDDLVEETAEEVTTDISIKPMTWDGFKVLPDEDKVAYIKAIREEFKPTDVAIAEMMGVRSMTFGKEVRRLGLGLGKNSRLGARHNWDKDGFYRWAFPTRYLKTAEDIAEHALEESEDMSESSAVKTTEDIAECVAVEETVEDTTSEAVCEALEAPVSGEQVYDDAEEVVENKAAQVVRHCETVVPNSGVMSFECEAGAALNMVKMLLSGSKVRIKVEWEVVEE